MTQKDSQLLISQKKKSALGLALLLIGAGLCMSVIIAYTH
jgi:hypothetical protein